MQVNSFWTTKCLIPNPIQDRKIIAWNKESTVAPGQKLFKTYDFTFPLWYSILCWPEVHESDLTENYSILKEYLLSFSSAKLPTAEDQKALVLCIWVWFLKKCMICAVTLDPTWKIHKGAFALLAVTLNIYPQQLYEKKGGKKSVKEPELFIENMILRLVV